VISVARIRSWRFYRRLRNPVTNKQQPRGVSLRTSTIPESQVMFALQVGNRNACHLTMLT